MSLYDNLLATARRLLSEKGRTVTAKRVAHSSFNPVTNSFASTSTQTFPIKAVFSNYNSIEIDGEIIQRGDKRALVSDYIPVKGDVLVDGSDEFTVIDYVEVKPGDVALIYKVQVRK